MSDLGQDAIELTRQLIRMDTVNPPGNEKVLAHFLGTLLTQGGFDVSYHEFEPARTSLVARFGASSASKPICFTGHLDTVPLGAAPWAVPPHGGQIVDDRLYGRGASDMKSGVAAFVTAALDYARRAPGEANLELVLTASEETGCQGANHLAKTDGALGQAGAIVVGEPTANYPFIGHKGVLWLQARTRGVTAHGSMPEVGVNAIYVARRVIEKLERFRFRETPHALLGSPTLSVGTMKSGSNINSVPDLAELGIDIRTVPGMCHSELCERLVDYLGPDLAELEGIIDMAPLYTSPDVPWIRRVFRLVTPIIGLQPEPRGAGYFTDACALKPAYRDAPTVILGPGEPSQAHQTNEYCVASRIVQAAKIYGLLMQDWCGAARHGAALLSRINSIGASKASERKGISVTSNNAVRLVGPVVTAGEFADAVLESMREDNPGKEFIVELNAAYMRIKVEGECILRMATLERSLGRQVRTGDLEMNMPSFAGFIKMTPEHVRFFSAA